MRNSLFREMRNRHGNCKPGQATVGRRNLRESLGSTSTLSLASTLSLSLASTPNSYVLQSLFSGFFLGLVKMAAELFAGDPL